VLNHLNYYKKLNLESAVIDESVTLEKAIIKVIGRHIQFHQRYKLMKRNYIAEAVAKTVLSPDFLNEIATKAIIRRSKIWLRNNVYTLAEILKQMDIRGGTLNYEGNSVLNDVESASLTGVKK
jgi:hypothetical protein